MKQTLVVIFLLFAMSAFSQDASRFKKLVGEDSIQNGKTYYIKMTGAELKSFFLMFRVSNEKEPNGYSPGEVEAYIKKFLANTKEKKQ